MTIQPVRRPAATATRAPASTPPAPKPSQVEQADALGIRHEAYANYIGQKTAAYVARPSSIAELQSIVRWGAQQGLNMRAAGAGHAYNRLAFPDKNTNGPGLLISMTGVRSVEVNPETKTAWVGAGTSMEELCATLGKHGFTIPGIPTGREITVGGVLASGVHSSSLVAGKPSQLADVVEEMQFVGSDGKLHTFNREEDLRLLRAHMGMFGVLTKVKLKLSPKYYVKHEQTLMTEKEAFGQLDKLAFGRGDRKAHRVRLVWLPARDTFPGSVVVWREDEVKAPSTTEEAERNSKALDDLRESQTARFKIAQRLLGASRVLHSDWMLKKLTQTLFNRGLEKPIYGWDSEMSMFEYGVKVPDVSMSVPYEHAHEAFEAIKSAFRETGFVPHTPIAVRFLQANEKAALSHNRGEGPRIAFQFVILPDFEDEKESSDRAFAWGEAYRLVTERLKALGGTVHLGKRIDADASPTLPLTAAELEAADKLRKRLDPQERFINNELRAILENTRHGSLK